MERNFLVMIRSHPLLSPLVERALGVTAISCLGMRRRTTMRKRMTWSLKMRVRRSKRIKKMTRLGRNEREAAWRMRGCSRGQIF